MKIFEQYTHEGQGYNPFLITPNWQVAQLNHALEEELESIDKLDIHFKTDEVFFLIEGKAVLIGAEIIDDRIQYDLQIMEPGVTYNIPKNVWHKIVMYEGSKVLIVEDANTHIGDFEFYHLSENQKAELREQVNQLIEEK